MRAQTTLPAVGLALLLLTAVSTLAVVTGDTVLQRADRQPLDRQAAVGLSERLLDPAGGVADRPNVLNASRLSSLDAATIRTEFGLDDGAAFALHVDDQPIASAGSPEDGVSFERIVLVENRTSRSRTPEIRPGRGVTLPRRVDRAVIDVSPPPGTTVRGVRSDGRVVLHSESGLDGSYTIEVSRFETSRLTFDVVGNLSSGSVTVSFRTPRTRKARLEVTVDA